MRNVEKPSMIPLPGISRETPVSDNAPEDRPGVYAACARVQSDTVPVTPCDTL